MKLILIFILSFSAMLNLYGRDVRTLIRSNGTEVATLDPALTSGIPAANILLDMYRGLYKLDRNGKIVPDLVSSHKVLKKGLVHVFKLKKSFWSDGKEVTAQNFVDAYKRIVKPTTGSEYAWYFETMGLLNAQSIIDGKMPASKLGVKAINKNTLQITLSRPVSYVTGMFINAVTYPQRLDIIKKYGDKWTNPKHYVSNGPFVLKTWKVNDKVVLVKNPKYYDAKNIYFNKIIYLPIGEKSAYDRYEAGNLDITSTGIPPSYLKKIKDRNSKEVAQYIVSGVYYYIFNLKDKRFKDVRVRRALSYAIDRDIIANKVLVGKNVVPTDTFIPRVLGYKTPVTEYSKLNKQQRIAKAVKLLKEAGYSKKNPLKFTLIYNTLDQHKKIAVVAQSMWNIAFKGAVKVSLLNQEWKTFLDTRHRHDFDVARGGWISDYLDSSSILTVLLSDSDVNDGSYKSKAFDNNVKKAASINNIKKRNNIYKLNDKLIVKDLPVLPIFFQRYSIVVKPYIKGMPSKAPLGYIPSRYLSRK